MADHEADKKTGFFALAAAVPFYVWSLLASCGFEPLLIVVAFVCFGTGVYLTSRAAAAAPNWEDPFNVRLNGAGEQGSAKRKQWVHIQTQRGRSIRQVLFFVLVGALALFVENHVMGSVWSSFSEKQAQDTKTSPDETATPETTNFGETTAFETTAFETTAFETTAFETSGFETSGFETSGFETSGFETSGFGETESLTQETTSPPKPKLGPGSLEWVSHADREANGRPYTVEGSDENLASVARTKETLPSLLGAANPAAVLVVDEPLKTSLNDEKVKEITIEDASKRLGLSAVLFASRFATTPLKANQTIKIPADRPYDPRQWIDWMLWTLIGMTAYLLLNVARHLRDVPDGDGDFLGNTSWYWTQLATGPIIAFIILLLFVHIDVDLLTGDESTFEVNLNQYPSDLLLVPAFLLGFYSRVTRELLDQLMRKIFGAAWRAANGDFEIVMKGQDISDGEIPSSSPVTFETKPPTTGTLWNATDGTIDSAGVFKPPPVVDAPKQVFVTAITPGTNRSGVKSVLVVKHKFTIKAMGKLTPGTDQVLTVEPAPPVADAVTWEIVAESVTLAADGAKATLTVPAEAKPDEKVTVKAKVAGLTRTIELKVEAA